MSQRDVRPFLEDIVRACDAVAAFIHGRDLESYRADLMLRSAVERQLMIVGEAVNKVRQADSLCAAVFGDVAGIVSFRNILVHGYFQINHEVVWRIAVDDAPRLRVAAFRELGSEPL
ncbi:MAG: DUF86 domain-containing protein [Phycisphaerales bacterium]|nr:DUF86 domain-containing protein [Phycisphaerales bacterium]